MRWMVCCLACACGAPRAEAREPEPVAHESGTEHVQARVGALTVEARERGVSNDGIRERWLSDALVLFTVADGPRSSGVLLWGGGERALTAEELNRSATCDEGAMEPAPLEVHGDLSSVAIVTGGDQALLITGTHEAPSVSTVACRHDVAVERSVCGNVVTCREDGVLRSVAGRWQGGALVSDDACAGALGALVSALRAAPQNLIDEGEYHTNMIAAAYENSTRPRCARPSASELARAREAIERLIAATPPDPEGALYTEAPADFAAAWSHATITCRHPRSHAFGVVLEDEHHKSAWWVSDDSVVEIARARVDGDALVTITTSAIDLDGDRVEELGVHVHTDAPAAVAPGCARHEVSCESTFLSGSWSYDDAIRRAPCLFGVGIDAEHQPAVFGEDAVPYALRGHELVPVETGFDEQRAAAARIHGGPEVIARIEARIVGPQAIDCAAIGTIREDLTQGLAQPISDVDRLLAGFAECPP